MSGMNDTLRDVVKIRCVAGSSVVSIPVDVMDELNLETNTKVAVHIAHGAIILLPIGVKR